MYHKFLFKRPYQFKILISPVLVLFFLGTSNRVPAQKSPLVEFGWDYPDVSQLSERLPLMQNTPFDGICFSLQRDIMQAFDKNERPAAYFENKKLQALKWGKYKSNYIILRGYSQTGGNWFDDSAWVNIEKNITALSQSLLSGKIKGILFDPEYYLDDKRYNPWTYSKVQYPELPFEDVQNKVRERGRAFMKALQSYKKDVDFVSIWLASLIAEEKKYTPLQDTRHALLLSFTEGMLLEKNKAATITDGNEYAYWNFKPSQFLQAPGWIRSNIIALVKSEKAKQLAEKIPVAQTIFYDGLLGRAPAFEKGIPYNDRWSWLKENLKFAFASTESIVWFYSERANWWKGGSINDTLTNILNSCRQINSNKVLNKKDASDEPFSFNTRNVNTGAACFYTGSEKTPMQTGDTAFTFVYQAKKRRLKIDFRDKRLPSELYVFTDASQTGKIINPQNTQIILLKKAPQKKLGILAKYPGNTEAASIQYYK